MRKLGHEEQALLAQLRAAGFKTASQISLEASRAGLTQMALSMAGPKVAVHAVHDERIAGPGGELGIRIYDPDPGSRAGPGVIVFFHGGGYYLGNLETHDHVCRFLCAHSRLPVVAVDYRLAPEHKFPAALDDCYSVVRWVAAQAASRGWDPHRIALVGDSAGGGLVASVCLLARAKGGPRIAYQVLVYPALTLDNGADFPSRKDLGSGEYFIAEEDWPYFRGLYLRDPEREASLPLVSPVRASDFRGLPPALIVAAEFDPCRDENARYAELLRSAGVPTEYVCFEGTIHPFFLFDGILEAGRRGQALVADRVHRAIGTAAAPG
ncbi:MAG TPA: alpha/beta hydrolase [Steroidobacteraceae bacterium]|nr:alpha/beta hydrolase [Steroidobacteraceae bacterium]